MKRGKAAKAIGVSHDVLRKRLLAPEEFKVKELEGLIKFIGCKESEIVLLNHYADEQEGFP